MILTQDALGKVLQRVYVLIDDRPGDVFASKDIAAIIAAIEADLISVIAFRVAWFICLSIGDSSTAEAISGEFPPEWITKEKENA